MTAVNMKKMMVVKQATAKFKLQARDSRVTPEDTYAPGDVEAKD